MLVSTVALAGLWILSGAPHWNGYPVDYSGGVAVTWVVAILVQVVLACIGLIALASRPPTPGILVAAIVCWSFARLATASCVPLGSDEAYYWLWSRRLDWGYYDHPGLIAWVARVLAPTAEQSAAAVRLTPVVSGAVLPAATYFLTRATLGSREIAARSGLVILLLPVFCADIFLFPNMLIDTLWIIAAALAWRACISDRLRDWLLAGAAFGMALNAKFTALSLPAAILVFLFASPVDRRRLLSRGPYAAVLAALITFAPTLIWNARNGWPTFALHFVRRQHALAFHPDWLLTFVAVTTLLLSPVIAAWTAGPGMAVARRALRDSHRGRLYLVCLAFTPIFATLVISSMQRAHAHQIAAAYAPVVALFVARTAGVSRWYPHGVRLALVISMIAFAALFVPALTPLPLATRIHRLLSPRDPQKMTAEVLGWSSLGKYLDAERQHDNAVVIAPSYAQASLAAHYGAASRVYSIDEGRSRYGQQLGRWNSLADIPPRTNAILFRTGHGRDEPAYEADIARLFDRLERVDTAAPGLDPRIKYFAIWRGIGWRGEYHPAPQSQPASSNGED